jgi:hypothetical protein
VKSDGAGADCTTSVSVRVQSHARETYYHERMFRSAMQVDILKMDFWYHAGVFSPVSVGRVLGHVTAARATATSLLATRCQKKEYTQEKMIHASPGRAVPTILFAHLDLSIKMVITQLLYS